MGEDACSKDSETSSSSDDGPNKIQPCVGILCRKPAVGKVVIAAGIAAASVGVADTFVLSVLKSKFWAHDMAWMGANLGIAMNVIAMLSGGAFGRFSDSVDRRVAMSIFMLASFLPAWVLIPFGLDNSTGLWLSCAVKVIGASTLASNVPIALLNDVTEFEDRELATGAFFALSNGIPLLLSGIPGIFITVLGVVEVSPFVMLLWSVTLSILALALLWSVPKQKGATKAEDPVQKSPAVRTTGLRAAIIEPIRLIAKHNRLKRLCTASFLLCFSGAVLMCVSGQFYNESLGLLPFGTEHDFALIALLASTPGQFLVIPGYLLTGWLSKQKGALLLMRYLIPITSLLLFTGVALTIFPYWWFLPLVVVAENYTGLTQVPLMRMVAGVAPPGRMGEALSAVGVSMQLAGFLGNVFVATFGGFITKIPIADPLWIYYPLCAVIHCLALYPVWGKPTGGHWGACSGLAEDQALATIHAVRAGQRWKRTTKMRLATQGGLVAVHEEGEECASEESSQEDNPDEEESSDVAAEDSGHGAGHGAVPLPRDERAISLMAREA